MILPQQTGPGGLWVLYDYNRKWKNSPAAAGGQAIATIATVPQDELWFIDLVRVSTTDGDETSKAYVCMDTAEFDVSGTATGNYDVADQSSPIHAPGGSEILIVWKNLADGKVGRAYVQWSVMRSSVPGA